MNRWSSCDFFCFDLCTRRPDFLEAKNGNRQWENLEKKRNKKKHKESKKRTTTSVTLLCSLKTFFAVVTFWSKVF